MKMKIGHIARACLLLVAAGSAMASSHREAPFITTSPKVDGSDFYMFNSYESSRSAFVTLIANYQPLQAPYGGPNYFAMDPKALYEIHVDNNGDAKEDLTFQFRFTNTLANGGNGVALNIGGKQVAIPLVQSGQVTAAGSASLNVSESYSVTVVRGDRRAGTAAAVTNAATGSAAFLKPVDNIGTKTIPNYDAYARQHIYSVNIPGCSTPARLFVGQRKDAFAVNLGTIFDLVNAPLAVITDPALINAAPNSIDDANVTTLALEVAKSCLTAGSETVIGGWTTASLRQARLLNPSPLSGHQASEKPGGAWVQVSRLGMPLVNEVVIGLKDKDKFNGSKPYTSESRNDVSNFADYVTNPTLPALLDGLTAAGHLVVLLSPAARASEYVEKEVAWWVEHKGAGSILLVQDAGELAWDDAGNRFSADSAVPASPMRGIRRSKRHSSP